MGRDRKYALGEIEDQNISTHTPAWGATSFRCFDYCRAEISTHTPAWGATLSSIATDFDTADFNSHARVGRDWLRADLIIRDV